MSHHDKKSGFFIGFLLIIVGILFLFNQYNWIDIGKLWPLAIVAVGIWMIIKPKRHSHDDWDEQDFGDKTFLTDLEDIYHSNTFGDINVTINSKNFRSGQIRTTFGSVKVDLSDLDITGGEQILQINTVFGDIKITVPQKVPYFIYGSNTAGDIKIFDEKRSGWKQAISYKSDDYDTSGTKLRIIAGQVFGDIKVK